MNEMPTPPDDPKWFFKLMPQWLIDRAAVDGVDIKNVSFLHILWLGLINKEMDHISEEIKKNR